MKCIAVGYEDSICILECGETCRLVCSHNIIKEKNNMVDIIYRNGDLKREDISKVDLKWVQEKIDGYVEVINLPQTKQVMLVDEDGIPKKLPINIVATEMTEFTVYGTVVLMSKEEWKLIAD